MYKEGEAELYAVNQRMSLSLTGGHEGGITTLLFWDIKKVRFDYLITMECPACRSENPLLRFLDPKLELI